MADNSRMAPLVQRYATGVDLLKTAVAGMTPDQRTARPVAGKWSTAEVVAHLAHFEVIGVDRLARESPKPIPRCPGGTSASTPPDWPTTIAILTSRSSPLKSAAVT